MVYPPVFGISRFVQVAPDIEDQVAEQLQNLEEHDDGDPGEETKSSSQSSHEIAVLEIQISLFSGDLSIY